ncbi:kinase-like protein [Aspergillus aculeatinus CBS 121060]|uniref:Kinase-like protein n=1 Tax=Aspergillus aculeatinus CBS 121060 TaxID=1448322 RepID=A0ACD1HPG4_9EURO|nr:kinase-like protein [Aspergillus aculeatinus CBS 121060]RAH75362.1 kinase-like protein [Aspergillus aculeatinus CBS 121060]
MSTHPTQPSQSLFVGTILTHDIHTGESTNPLAIYSDKVITIGRSTKCDYVIKGKHISRRHLRIHTVVFDRDNPSEIAPLVYAQDLSMNVTTWNGHPMGRSAGGFLLTHGDILCLKGEKFLMFNCADRVYDKPTPYELQQEELQLLNREFVLTHRKLGLGGFATVYMAYRRDKGRQLACKVLDLRPLRDQAIRSVRADLANLFENPGSQPSEEAGDPGVMAQFDDLVWKRWTEKRELLLQEVMILKDLSHPNIVSLEKVVCSPDTYYIFQELVTGGDLFSYMQYKGGKLANMEVASVVRQILLALDYLHDQNIVHCDLKLDNILMTTLEEGGRVVLTDFGCATRLNHPMEKMAATKGTIAYRAPEMLERRCTKAIDMWSLGCVATILLTGELLPDSSFESWADFLARETGVFHLLSFFYSHKIRVRAQNFICHLLEMAEDKRMTAKEALEHEWFSNRSHGPSFQDLYSRACRGWVPRAPGDPIVELSSYTKELETNESPKCYSGEGSSHSGTDSDREDQLSLTSTVPDRTCHLEASPTLSDPVLPPMRDRTSSDEVAVEEEDEEEDEWGTHKPITKDELEVYDDWKLGEGEGEDVDEGVHSA